MYSVHLPVISNVSSGSTPGLVEDGEATLNSVIYESYKKFDSYMGVVI